MYALVYSGLPPQRLGSRLQAARLSKCSVFEEATGGDPGSMGVRVARLDQTYAASLRISGWTQLKSGPADAQLSKGDSLELRERPIEIEFQLLQLPPGGSSGGRPLTGHASLFSS